MSLLFRDVEVDGCRVDVRTAGTRVSELGTRLPTDGSQVVDGRAGALIPGLHDHHVHLLALAAAATSVNCAPPAVRTADQLGTALSAAPAEGAWVRAVGYDESVAGPLDRHVLDRLAPGRPVRVQYRSGALWVLNSLALAQVRHVLDGTADVERDERGEPTGRLWRYDARLRPALPKAAPDLATVGRRLAGYGLTGVTDATPDLDDEAVALISEALCGGTLRTHVSLLGAPTGALLPAGLSAGPRKLLLRDHDLPTYDELLAEIAETHARGRPVAVHCVTRESLLLTLAVLDEAGPLDGDRIEHAGVVPEGIGSWIASQGLRVVTQPDFLRTRGDDYLRDADPQDLPWLYPWAALMAAGVRTVGSSDAPFGALDPWQVMRSAVWRTTAEGRVIGPGERVDAATALAGYLSRPEDPGGPVRRVAPGARADLCLLRQPLDAVLADPDAGQVRLVTFAGDVV